jgi:hypothetical protein
LLLVWEDQCIQFVFEKYALELFLQSCALFHALGILWRVDFQAVGKS